ncbi:MAG: HlyD family efflux transporter periplasmic adaptor subunit [Bacillota bacterium]|jgi:putative membrane fusion protein
MKHTNSDYREKIIRNRKRKKFHNSRLIKRRILKIVLVVTIILAVWYLRNIVSWHFLSFGVAEWGVLEQKIPVQAVIIRAEKVVSAPASGEFVSLVPQGERVPAGTAIGYIKTQSATTKIDRIKIPIKAPLSGLVSYYPDGLESILKSNMLNEMDNTKLDSLLQNKLITEKNKDNNQIGRGEPVLKIVDNLINPSFFFKLTASNISPLSAKEDNIVIQLDGEKKRYTAKVIDMRTYDEEIYMIVQINGVADLDLARRYFKVEVIPVSYEGVIVPKEALVHKEGFTGIYVPSEGLAKLVEVKVKGTIGEQAVVHGLETGKRFVLNSSLVKEGSRLE